LIEVEPVRRATSLKLVWAAMRWISPPSCVTSFWIALLSAGERVPLSYCTASSRTRWSIECTSLIAPSAVATSEIASWPLRWAWARPPICARSFSEIASPAESSAALLMR